MIFNQTNGGGGAGEVDPPNDGKTHLFIRVPCDGFTYLTEFARGSTGSLVSIDWGDGNIEEISTSRPTHIYAKSGDYEVVLKVVNSYWYTTSLTFGATSLTGTSEAQKRVGIFRRLYFYDSNFHLDSSLPPVSINPFRYATNLEVCVVEQNINYTSTVGNLFSGCYALRRVSLPSSISTFGSNAFRYCMMLEKFTVPSSTTSINLMFGACLNLGEIHFLGATPPTASSGAFTGVPTSCKIYVPTGMLSAYTSATNYPDPATYTYIEE